MSDIEGAICDECGARIGPNGCCADTKRRAQKQTNLQLSLTLALDALREIQEHEHCKVKLHRCSVPIEEWRELCAECEKEDSTMYVVGRIEGHRCCAAIAKAALEKIGVKK